MLNEEADRDWDAANPSAKGAPGPFLPACAVCHLSGPRLNNEWSTSAVVRNEQVRCLAVKIRFVDWREAAVEEDRGHSEFVDSREEVSFEPKAAGELDW